MGNAETEFSNFRFKTDGQGAEGVYKNTQALMAEGIANTVFC